MYRGVAPQTGRSMRMYVTGFDLKHDYKDAVAAGKPVLEEDSSDVFYSPRPLWTEPTREIAELRVAELHRVRIHVGDHYCKLDVEQISGSEFAMVCNDHPQSSRYRSVQGAPHGW
jgi:hypothetical protein